MWIRMLIGSKHSRKSTTKTEKIQHMLIQTKNQRMYNCKHFSKKVKVRKNATEYQSGIKNATLGKIQENLYTLWIRWYLVRQYLVSMTTVAKIDLIGSRKILWWLVSWKVCAVIAERVFKWKLRWTGSVKSTHTITMGTESEIVTALRCGYRVVVDHAVQELLRRSSVICYTQLSYSTIWILMLRV